MKADEGAGVRTQIILQPEDKTLKRHIDKQLCGILILRVNKLHCMCLYVHMNELI